MGEGRGNQETAFAPLLTQRFTETPWTREDWWSTRSSEKEGSPSMIETRYEHIVLNESGVPMIVGTTMKVIELVLDSKAYGWSPAELHFQHPYLTLGQIHSALAYYWDHQDELDQDIARRLQFVDQLQQATKPTPLETRLKATGLR